MNILSLSFFTFWFVSLCIYISFVAVFNISTVFRLRNPEGSEKYFPRWVESLHAFVFTEEMFSSNQGLWWSPGGKYVAYAEFNDTEVHTIEYSWYGENQYPDTVSIPYPKVGYPDSISSILWHICLLYLFFFFLPSLQPGSANPVVKLFVVDTDNTTKITEVVVPALFSSE